MAHFLRKSLGAAAATKGKRGREARKGGRRRKSLGGKTVDTLTGNRRYSREI
jgi:hypothetical protein